MDQNYLHFGALWIAYFILHSLAASLRVKRYFESIGMSVKTYRLIFVILSTTGLLAILFYGSTFTETEVVKSAMWMKLVSMMLAASGVFIIKASFKQYRLREFIGLSKENPEKRMHTGGILSYIRHPLYAGTILIVLGYLFYVPKLTSVIIVIITILYIAIGIYLEEKKLIIEFGDRYRSYKDEVPALVPRLRDIISF